MGVHWRSAYEMLFNGYTSESLYLPKRRRPAPPLHLHCFLILGMMKDANPCAPDFGWIRATRRAGIQHIPWSSEIQKRHAMLLDGRTFRSAEIAESFADMVRGIDPYDICSHQLAFNLCGIKAGILCRG